jgi:hypothetical protein
VYDRQKWRLIVRCGCTFASVEFAGFRGSDTTPPAVPQLILGASFTNFADYSNETA